MQLYLDDPLWTVAGSATGRRFTVAMNLWTMLAIGCNLSWGKGSRGAHCDWIGFNFRLTATHINATVMPQFADELEAQTIKINASTIASTKELRSYTGTRSHLAGIVLRMRWVVNVLHSVIASVERELASSTSSSRALRARLVPTKRFKLPLVWMTSLLKGRDTIMIRTLPLQRPPSIYPIITDGCPWGIGALLIDTGTGTPLAAISDSFDDNDVNQLNVKIGDAKSQQIADGASNTGRSTLLEEEAGTTPALTALTSGLEGGPCNVYEAIQRSSGNELSGSGISTYPGGNSD
jgi:hypothetical protein